MMTTSDKIFIEMSNISSKTGPNYASVCDDYLLSSEYCSLEDDALNDYPFVVGAGGDGETTADSYGTLRPEQELMLYKHQLNQRQSANARERSRTFHVNKAFNTLRELIPTKPANRKLSKIETLHLAISYIAHLSTLLETNEQSFSDFQTDNSNADLDFRAYISPEMLETFRPDTNAVNALVTSSPDQCKQCQLEMSQQTQPSNKPHRSQSNQPAKRGRKPYKSRMYSLSRLRNQNDHRYCTFCAFNNNFNNA